MSVLSKKVFLVNTNSDTYRKPEENLGLAYIKSFLDKKDITVKYIDGFLCDLSNDEIIKEIKKEKDILLVGIAMHIDSQNYVLDIAEKIKKLKPKIKICIGGHVASFSDKELLQNKNIDVIIRGEGESSMFELCNALLNKKNFFKISNLSYRDRRGRIISNFCRPLIEDLDTLPFPDREYLKLSVRQGSLAHISSSRGCYANCSFCSINSLYKLGKGAPWRARSAKNTVDEIEMLVKKYKVRVFKFVDDSFFGAGKDWKKRPKEIAHEILKRNLNIKFRISARVNNIDEDTFSLLKKAGLYAISLGVESASQNSLNLYNKGITPKESQAAIDVLNKLNIQVLAGFIGFEPYMSFEDVKKNYLFLDKNRRCIFDIISKPLFVHANDAITRKLLKDNLIKKRSFPNYKFTFEDARVNMCHQALSFWNEFNKDIYYKVIDPLSSPRLVRCGAETKLLELYKRLRTIDLSIYKLIIYNIEDNKSLKEIKNRLLVEKIKNSSEWVKINKEFKLIIKK